MAPSNEKPARELSAAELRTRAPVWCALSELWLDTQLPAFAIEHIANVLAESPYSIEELADIHHYEVAPAVWMNLASVAGEWTGLDTEWLTQRCHRNARRRPTLLYRLKVWLQRPMLRYHTDDPWQRIAAAVHALRSDRTLPRSACDE